MDSITWISDAMARLGYDPKWLAYGFIDRQFLEDQIARHESGNDKDTEHFRYAAFRSVIENRTKWDDRTVDQIVELVALDEDRSLAESALGLLIRSVDSKQLERLRIHATIATPPLQRIFETVDLLRSIGPGEISDEVFDRCIALRSSEVQRKLLDGKLTPTQLCRLIDQGASRAIKNLAKGKINPDRCALSDPS
jgi:hypothetical protein